MRSSEPYYILSFVTLGLGVILILLTILFQWISPLFLVCLAVFMLLAFAVLFGLARLMENQEMMQESLKRLEEAHAAEPQILPDYSYEGQKQQDKIKEKN